MLFCALLRPFALFCKLAFALFGALFLSGAPFCIRPCLERLCLALGLRVVVYLVIFRLPFKNSLGSATEPPTSNPCQMCASFPSAASQDCSRAHQASLCIFAAAGADADARWEPILRTGLPSRTTTGH